MFTCRAPDYALKPGPAHPSPLNPNHAPPHHQPRLILLHQQHPIRPDYAPKPTLLPSARQAPAHLPPPPHQLSCAHSRCHTSPHGIDRSPGCTRRARCTARGSTSPAPVQAVRCSQACCGQGKAVRCSQGKAARCSQGQAVHSGQGRLPAPCLDARPCAKKAGSGRALDCLHASRSVRGFNINAPSHQLQQQQLAQGAPFKRSSQLQQEESNAAAPNVTPT